MVYKRAKKGKLEHHDVCMVIHPENSSPYLSHTKGLKVKKAKEKWSE